MSEPLFEQAHGSTGAEHANCYEDSDEVGNDADGGLKTVFGSVDKSLIYIDFFDGGLDDEPTYDTQQNNRCDEGGEGGELLFGQALCQDEQEDNECGKCEEYAENDFVPDLDFLRCAAGE